MISGEKHIECMENPCSKKVESIMIQSGQGDLPLCKHAKNALHHVSLITTVIALETCKNAVMKSTCKYTKEFVRINGVSFGKQHTLSTE